MTDSELKRLAVQFVQKSWDRGWIPGLLGRLNSDGTVTIEVDGKVGWVHVRMGPDGKQGNDIALNMGVALRANTPIRMRRENGILVVYSRDTQRGLTFGGDSGASIVGPHTHRIGSGYEYEIEMLRLEAGRVRHYSGMTVTIGPFRYQTADGNWHTWASDIIDLTSYKPSNTGNHAWVLVGIDSATNAAVAVTGTEYGYATPLTIDLIDDIDFSGYIPCGAVRVRQDDSSLASISRYQDAHGWFNSSGGSSSGGVASGGWVVDYAAIILANKDAHIPGRVSVTDDGTLTVEGELYVL